MQTAVAILRNPFRPELNREVYPVADTVTIRQWLDRYGIAEFE
ncbi:MAG: hypothetical protein OIF34_06400 [Porticoccaceae bacterium]|nr:hypothetical protein [Porticoccaceae bacterium]